MTIIKPILAATTALALAACGGTSEEDIIDVILSDGAIEGLELPSEEDLADLPEEAQDLLEELQETNESFSRTGTLPGGNATYVGRVGLEIAAEEDGEETAQAYLFGDMTAVADFVGMAFDGDVTGITGQLASGEDLAITGDLAFMGGLDMSDDTEIESGLSGDLTVTGGDAAGTYSISAIMDGTFAGNEAARALGTIEGSVTNPDDSTDSVFGAFLGEKQ